MTIDGEPAKILLPYLQRADELQKHDHLAAYYCRLYAMEKGLKIPPKERTNETKLILISLMNQLEKDKKVVKLSPDDNMYMEGFALRVFAKADKQDRAGRADLKTAMTFYAASIFFEVLLQFGELPPDIQEKQKYASWKAVDIRKAVAEGRKPVPGPPVTEKDASEEDFDSTLATEGPPSTSAPEPPQQPLSPASNKDASGYPDAASHRTFTPPTPPSAEPPSAFFQHSYSKSSEDFNLPSAPSNPIPPSYTPEYPSSAPPDSGNAGYPSGAPYSHSSGTPFDSLGGNDSRAHTIGTYSYPSDPPGFTTSPPPGYSNYAPQDPAHQQYHHHQHPQPPPQWPSPPTPFNDPTSTYPSVFPSQGPPVPPPQGPPAPPLARTSSAPAKQPDSSSGYQLNGNYDVEYKPTPGQVVEAHKASRFAVSALAFDDIPTAISYLRKSLELLTSPSAIE